VLDHSLGTPQDDATLLALRYHPGLPPETLSSGSACNGAVPRLPDHLDLAHG
jgi:hypothetical protein